MSRDTLAAEHEHAFARSFLIRERRDRWVSQLAAPKKRRGFLERLNHRLLADIDERFISSAPPDPAELGAESCYLISSDQDLDGIFVPTLEVEDTLGHAYFGLIASFLPGRLACYKDEAPAGIVWLYRA